MALTDSLVAYWSLSDLTDSHGSNTLTNNNTATFTTGKVGNAANFARASSQYLSIADNAALSMGDIDFTIACWVQIGVSQTNSAIAGKWGTVGEYLLLYVSNRFYFSVRNLANSATANAAANTLGAPSTSTWYYIVAQHDSVNNLVKIKVNNGAWDSVAHSGGVRDGIESFAIGAYHTPSGFWDGLVDELAIWKRCLSDAEITDLYNGGSGRDYAYIAGAGATGQPMMRRWGGSIWPTGARRIGRGW